MDITTTALVLGATGGIGGEVARQLHASGWTVRAMRRGGAPHAGGDGLDWVDGDAMVAADVAAAARGCGVIVHAVNPPGYRRWAELVLPMLDHTLAAARHEGATIVLPGTVYNFGPDAFPVLSEASPQHPTSRKGAIRVEMERRLRGFADAGGRVLIVRAGDFFGPHAGNNWFSQGLVKPGQPVARITDPGTPGVAHAWAYLPDAAATIVRLLERRDALDPFAAYHLSGHEDADGTAMAKAVQRVVASRTGTTPPIRRFPWWAVALGRPFVPLFRELHEVRHLWREPLRLDNAKLVAELDHEPHTPLDEAVEATLVGQGCLTSVDAAPGRQARPNERDAVTPASARPGG